jgi:hypothetical protein
MTFRTPPCYYFTSLNKDNENHIFLEDLYLTSCKDPILRVIRVITDCKKFKIAAFGWHNIHITFRKNRLLLVLSQARFLSSRRKVG